MTEREMATLREAWAAREPRAPGPDCPPAEAIWEAVAGSRPENDVQAMLTHSLECADCSALWRLARELRGASADSPPAGNVVPLRARPSRWVAVVGTLAAAAAVVLVLLPRSAGHRPEPVIRGTEGAALRQAPATATLDRGHAVLRWTGAPDGSRFTVVVSTRDLTVLYRRSGVVGSQLDLPPETLTTVPSGAEIVWRVEAIAPGGLRMSSEAFVSRVQ